MIPEMLHVHGPGRCGMALARMLRARGTRVLSLSGGSGRHGAPAAAELGVSFTTNLPSLPRGTWLLIAVPDDALARVAAELAEGPLPDAGWALHPSAMHGRKVLAPLAARGMVTAAFHPLRAFAPGAAAFDLAGALVAVDAEPAHEPHLRALAEALCGVPVHVPDEARTAWHLGATLAGNAPLALLHLAVRVWQRAGVEPELAWRALAALATPVVERAGADGARGLTGPVARGDRHTVAEHLLHMAREHPEALALLRELDRELLRAAEALPDSAARREGVKRLLEGEGA